ncbi:uncharacterized protein [Drosophila bipectinata]|uniref:uncharacterized protein n=1 Tax=Drosophila bipectinata TaxID=42026 RepID=UPI001C8A948F|nr:uncharacterized protein LOC108126748 [Drosophila bipectinata]
MIRSLIVVLSCCLILALGYSLEEVTEEFEGGTTPPIIDHGFPSAYDDLPELKEPSAQDQDVLVANKINWLPVYEESDNLRLVREVDQEQATTLLPETSPANPLLVKENKDCPTDAHRGLTNLIRVARPLLPVSRLANILANAAEDPQVQNLIKLLRSDRFKEQVSKLRSSKQHQALLAFICQKLQLDPTVYIQYVRVFLNVHTSEPPTSPLPNRRQGIRGLLQDLRDALPRAALRDMYLRLYSSDSQLANSVRLIRGVEFRRLLRNLRGLKEYQSIVEDLEKSGVSVRQVHMLVSNALGWSSVDFGSETSIVDV